MGAEQAKPAPTAYSHQPMMNVADRSYEPGPSRSGAKRFALWKPENAKAEIETFEAHLTRHAILSWVLVPIFVCCQAWIPPLTPTCDEGFRDATIVVVLLIEMHHIFSERSAWQLAKGLISPPELSVLRQLGFLRRRSRLVILGILEGMDLYTDLCFPFIARACAHVFLTERWQESWKEVPYIGHPAIWVLDHFRFWGICMVFTGINVFITGFVGIAGMWSHMAQRKRTLAVLEENSNMGCPRIGGEVWFGWAMSSSTAMMPSLVQLCEAMADQKKYVYLADDSKSYGRATEDVTYRGATKAREDAILGRLSEGEGFQYELSDHNEQERVERAGQWHYVRLLVVKVFIGNVLSLWLQGSFLALQFDTCGQKTRMKIIFSMAISAIQALVRCGSLTSKAGFLGCLLSLVIMFFIAWTGAKIYFAYECEDHLWGLTTGCVTMKHTLQHTMRR